MTPTVEDQSRITTHIPAELRDTAVSCEEASELLSITARIPAELRGTLEQAAQLQGATLDQFVVQSAFQEAQRVVERETVIHLSRRDAQKVFSLLDCPPKPNARLKEAVTACRAKVRV